MTRNEIIRMAREIGLEYREAAEELNSPYCDGIYLDDLERFAAAIERQACGLYLKQGETPAERIERDHRDSLALMTLLKQEKHKSEVLQAQRDHSRAQFDSAVKLLTRIQSLLYPAPFVMPDRRTMVFRPKSPDPHEVLQELSDRIRAIPNELAAIAKAEEPL